MTSYDQWVTAAPDDDDDGYNYPALTVDGTPVSDYTLDDPEELERVQVSFPAKENGEQEAADERAPLGWVNSAAITLDRGDDAVHLTISVGDPRGAFSLTVRRLSDGSLVMHFPHPNESYLHMPLTLDHEGTYRIG